MRKVLISVIVLASLALQGCSTSSEESSTMSNIANAIPDALDRAPLIYRPEIQQGNVVTQEQINALEPGMSRRQVRFVLGSPMLTDVFHADRWDYAFTLGIGSKPSEIRLVTVHFENDRLARISGAMRPQPVEEREPVEREVIVTVPDWEPPPDSLWERFKKTVTFSE